MKVGNWDLWIGMSVWLMSTFEIFPSDIICNKIKSFSYHIQKHMSIKIPFLVFRHSCFPTITSHSSVQQSVMRKNVVSAIPQQNTFNTPGTSTKDRRGSIHEPVKNTVAKKQVDLVTVATSANAQITPPNNQQNTMPDAVEGQSFGGNTTPCGNEFGSSSGTEQVREEKFCQYVKSKCYLIGNLINGKFVKYKEMPLLEVMFDFITAQKGHMSKFVKRFQMSGQDYQDEHLNSQVFIIDVFGQFMYTEDLIWNILLESTVDYLFCLYLNHTKFPTDDGLLIIESRGLRQLACDNRAIVKYLL